MSNRPFPVDPVLTAISLGYRNPSNSLIADIVLPRVPVMAEKFSWTRYPVAQAFTVPSTLVGRRGRVERVEFSGKQEDSRVLDYGLEFSVPQTDIDEAKAMRARGLGNHNPVDYSTMALTDLILLDREVRAAAQMQNPDSYAANKRLALSGSDRFSEGGSQVIAPLKAAFNGTLIYRPNTMTMSRAVWSVVSSHPEIVNAVKGNVTSKGIVTPEEFVRLFEGEGLKTLAIGEAFLNTARPGQSASLSRVWGNNIMLTHVNPMANPMTGGVTFGFTAEYGKRIAGQWETKDIGLEGGQVVRVGERVRELIVAKDAGYLIQNVIANTEAPTIVPYEPAAA
ncbi:Capsid protein [Methylorubrum populi]